MDITYRSTLLLRLIFISLNHINKDENFHRFALSAIRGEFLERKREWERERERDPHNLEREASIDHPIGEGLGYRKNGWTVVTSMKFNVILI